MVMGAMLGSSISLTTWATSPASPAMLSHTCNGCHGTDGNSAGLSNPTIAGLDVEYFEIAMTQFKSGERPSSIMGRLAKGYTDEQIKAMAAFFASKKFVAAKQTADSGKAKQGKVLHDKSCEKCHGSGSKAGENGALAGQWKEYLELTFGEFRSGKRKGPDKMKRPLAALSDADIDALINYYVSQK
ncbi:MAG: c-type cytochrome [Sterolibacterium sp.]